MLLNSIEYRAMNNPLRALVQRHYFEELSAETWKRGIGRALRRVLDHPYDDMFEKQEFVNELKALGFETETHESNPASFYFFWGSATKIPRTAARRC